MHTQERRSTSPIESIDWPSNRSSKEKLQCPSIPCPSSRSTEPSVGRLGSHFNRHPPLLQSIDWDTSISQSTDWDCYSTGFQPSL
ncbi:unnamed protein product [Rhodiola kirilowii]